MPKKLPKQDDLPLSEFTPTTGDTSPPSLPVEPAPTHDGLLREPEPEQAAPKSYDETITMRVRDGKVAVDAMRDKTRNRLFEVLKATPDFAPVVNTPPEESKPIEIKPIEWYIGLNGLGALTAKIFSYFSGAHPDDCARAFAWNHDMVSAVQEPANAVIKKYAHILAALKYKEEAALALALTSVINAQLGVLKELRLQRESGNPVPPLAQAA